MRVNKDLKTPFIHSRKLKEIIKRTVIRKNGGIPQFMVAYIIQDMIKLKLIERKDFNTYQIIESDCDKKIRGLLAFC